MLHEVSYYCGIWWTSVQRTHKKNYPTWGSLVEGCSSHLWKPVPVLLQSVSSWARLTCCTSSKAGSSRQRKPLGEKKMQVLTVGSWANMDWSGRGAWTWAGHRQCLLQHYQKRTLNNSKYTGDSEILAIQVLELRTTSDHLFPLCFQD